MNKKTFLSLLILGLGLFPLLNTNAEYTGACIQKVQAAISSDGQCRLFSNPCNVPNDWKHISSCENFKEDTEGKDISDINKRRFDISKWKNKRKNTTTSKKPKRALKRTISGGTWNRISSKKADLSEKKNRRTFSKRKHYSRKLFEDKKEKTQTPYKRTARRRLATATSPRKTGKISNIKWSTNKNNHFRKKDYSKKRAWKSYTTLRNEEQAANKKEYKPRSATLRKRWVGNRQEGSLD